jgi:hypothetical protein
MKNHFLLLFLFIPAVLNSQTFESGYFINVDNDTIYGMIQRPSDVFASGSFLYKDLEDSSRIKEPDPRSIKSIFFDRDSSFYEGVHLGRDFYFGKVLVSGKSNLYKSVHPQSGNTFYILKDSSGYYKLEQSIEETRTHIRTNNKYIGLLSYLLRDCSAIERDEIERTRYEDKALIGLIEKYNYCLAPGEEVYIYDTRKGVLRSNMVSLNTFIYKAPSLNVNYSKEFIYPELSSNISFNLGLEYYMGLFPYQVNDSIDEKTNEISNVFSVPVFFKYFFNRDRF